MVYCSDECYWITGGQGACREKRNCVCNVCQYLVAINLNLFEACVGKCNVDDASQRPATREAFESMYDPVELWKRYGYITKGFDPKKTDEYRLSNEKQKRIEEQEETQKNIIVILVCFLVLVGIYLVFLR